MASFLPFAGDDAQLTIAPKRTLISIISESVEQRHDRPSLTDPPDRALKAQRETGFLNAT
ncbi:MAG: hypothetical protein KME42_10285 [Tildeniella nuda ZEHNDER 1965/U140]|nr:hypothetical protein [Tildeniella nuda ZEHNDER 1965/U140]